MSVRSPFPMMPNDDELFGQDFHPIEYEYFCKHLEAFKSMWLEKTIEDKLDFVEEFFDYAENYGYIREFPLKTGLKKKFFEISKDFLVENFAKVKFSAAKNLIKELPIIAGNKDKILQFGTLAKAKDPFYMKDTRDTFRRFFGHPGDENTLRKAAYNLPLYTRFGGAVCRALRRWVEGHQAPPDGARNPKKKTSSSSEPQMSSEASSDSEKVIRIKRMIIREGKIVEFHQETVVEDEEKKEVKNEEKKEAKKDERKEEKEEEKREAKKEVKREEKNKVVREEKKEERKEEKKESKGEGNKGIKKEERKEEKKERQSKSDIAKTSQNRLHHCSSCHETEFEVKTFKKCALCKGKGTRFYCSKECQTKDWLKRHRQHHLDIGMP